MTMIALAGLVSSGCGAEPDSWQVTGSVEMSAEELEDLDRALEDWREIAGDCGPSIAPLTTGRMIGEFPRKGEVFVKPGDPGTTTAFRVDGDRIVYGDPVEAMGDASSREGFGTRVVFRRSRDEIEAEDRRRVFLHELGHAFGLEHTVPSPSVMSVTSRVLTPLDASAYRARWHCD